MYTLNAYLFTVGSCHIFDIAFGEIHLEKFFSRFVSLGDDEKLLEVSRKSQPIFITAGDFQVLEPDCAMPQSQVHDIVP